MTKLFTIILGLMMVFTSSAQIQISQNCKSDIYNINKQLHLNDGKVSDGLLSQYPINKINGSYYLSVLAKVNSNFNKIELESDAIIVGAIIKDIVSLKFPLTQLSSIDNLNGIDMIQVAGKIRPTLSKVLKDIRADSVHAGINLPQAFTGQDVLIGITDWGFDYTHPNFYDTLLQDTRILAAWDQYKTSGPTPVGFNYGTEFSTPTDLLNAGSDTSNIYSYNYHGSHVAGITGGSGAGTVYRGVAFEAQYLFATFLVDESSVLDAWQWMYDKSITENKNLVINMSWGLYHTGALDGTSLLSQALDNFSDLGVLFVSSAGNNGDNNFHIKKEFTNDTLLTRVNYSSTAYSQYYWGQSLHAWGDVDGEFSAGLQILNSSNVLMGETPMFSTLTTTSYVDSFVVVNGVLDTIWYNLAMDNMYPTNNRPQMRLRVKKNSSYKTILKSFANSGTVHYWNVGETTTDVGNWGDDFTSIGVDYTAGDAKYGIGAPACSGKAISVAAHSSENVIASGAVFGGSLANFSSEGPLMNEMLKPDISAPGVSVGSSVSSFTDASYNVTTTVSFNGNNYDFTKISGTSMSSPVVAGVCALVWEANPYLASWQVKDIIIQTAREDVKTGDITSSGSTEWGFGKVNAYQAIQLALTIVGANENAKVIEWSLYPNPTSELLNIHGLEKDVKYIQIVNLNGQLIKELNYTNQIDINKLSNGIYILRLINDNHVEQRKFIVKH
jgi:minor extracellular serine protease Vpr